jgi:hypothetical protein
MGFVGLAWRGNDEAVALAVEGVHEFLFFDGGNHKSTAFGIDRQILPWGDPAAARLAEGLLMYLPEMPGIDIILENDHSAGIRANDQEIMVHLHNLTGTPWNLRLAKARVTQNSCSVSVNISLPLS